MRTKGGEGVKNPENFAGVLYGWSPTSFRREIEPTMKGSRWTSIALQEVSDEIPRAAVTGIPPWDKLGLREILISFEE